MVAARRERVTPAGAHSVAAASAEARWAVELPARAHWEPARWAAVTQEAAWLVVGQRAAASPEGVRRGAEPLAAAKRATA